MGVEQMPGNRVLKLGKVIHYQKNFKHAAIVVSGDGYMGEARAKAAKVISDCSRAQHIQEKAAYLMVVDAVDNPDDVLAVPTMAESADHVRLEWVRNGRQVRMNLGELLTLKEIAIPDGTNMVIDLYEHTDPEFGPCLGLRLKGARFEPVEKRKSKAAK